MCFFLLILADMLTALVTTYYSAIALEDNQVNVVLDFDYLSRDKRQRDYIVEVCDSDVLKKHLQPFINR